MTGQSNNQLAHFEKAKRELALSTSISEVKETRDKAEALRAYAKQAGESLEMQNNCAEIKIRAERRAGELLQETDKNGGGRPKKTSNTMLQVSLPTLMELGLTRMQSSRWQTIANIPERMFEEHVQETMARAKAGDTRAELTSVGVLKLAKIQQRRQKQKKYGSNRRNPAAQRKPATSNQPRSHPFYLVFVATARCSDRRRDGGANP